MADGCMVGEYAANMSEYLSLFPGDPAPYFNQRSVGNPSYAFDTAAGRYIVLCFFGSASTAHTRAAIAAARSRPDLFDDNRFSFFGVSNDPEDETERRVADRYPGYRFFWDFDLSVARLYGVVPNATPTAGANLTMRRLWMVLDPTLRVLRVFAFRQDRSEIAQVLGYLDKLPPPLCFAGFEVQAPVIILPNVFGAEFCQRLIQHYETEGSRESGFVREVDGKTVIVTDHSHKRRRDCVINESGVIADLQALFRRRVVPEIAKVHQFHVTRMERYVIACYSSEDGGHFRPHRDNTTKGTAHRRFAVSVNLNDEYEGGELRFPEYGPRSFKVPAGGAVVFSCSLLHAVSPVTAGKRYAFLPFLYDDAAARIREENNRYLGEGVGSYADTSGRRDG
jgi:peroxiredoxin/predicted 2-oxoglutarate/Fe(II)-dependent dioxygenase YbiX